MLQADGLVEMETNQRGNVTRFDIDDLEQTCAQLVLNVPAAILLGGKRSLAASGARLHAVIDRLERLSTPQPGMAEPRRNIRHQLTFRRLIGHLCQPAGKRVVGHIDLQLDRLAMIRQTIHATGAARPYPLPDRFPTLRGAIDAQDAAQVAWIVYDLLYQLSHFAISMIAPGHRPDLLDSHARCAAAFCRVDEDTPARAMAEPAEK